MRDPRVPITSMGYLRSVHVKSNRSIMRTISSLVSRLFGASHDRFGIYVEGTYCTGPKWVYSKARNLLWKSCNGDKIGSRKTSRLGTSNEADVRSVELNSTICILYFAYHDTRGHIQTITWSTPSDQLHQKCQCSSSWAVGKMGPEFVLMTL